VVVCRLSDRHEVACPCGARGMHIALFFLPSFSALAYGILFNAEGFRAAYSEYFPLVRLSMAGELVEREP